MNKITKLVPIAALLLTLSACESRKKLTDPAPAPLPIPAPAPQTSQRFNAYNDALYNDGVPTSDPQQQLWASAPNFLENQHATALSNLAAEGSQFFRLHTEGDVVNKYVHLTYDRDLTGRTVDVSMRTVLAFSLRYHNRVLMAGDEVFVFVEDGNGLSIEVALQSAQGIVVGDMLDTWQNVRIPMSAFTGIDFSKLKKGFGVRIGNKVVTDADEDPAVVNHLDVEFDDIRYES